MSSKPTVAITIPAYNEEAHIEACIISCAQQDDLAEEIIVVDNNSSDRTVEIVKECIIRFPKANIKLIHESKQGLLPARDHGLRVAKSDVLGRIDADAKLEQGWVTAVRQAFSDEKVMAASGPVMYHDMPLRKIGGKVDDTIRAYLHRQAKDHKFLFGTNMAVRASAWKQIKDSIPADPKDEHHEDVSIALTLFSQNLEISYVPNMKVGMSARRIEDRPREFYRYVMRFERTLKAHHVTSARARIPIFIYLLIYFPVRTVRKFYDEETNKFTLRKLREDVSLRRSE